MNTIFAHEPLFPHVGHEPILCFSHFFTIIKRFAALPSFCLKKHNTINTGHGPPKPTCLKRGFYGFSRPPVFQISKKPVFFHRYWKGAWFQEIRWTFVGLLHFILRHHRTCSIGEYRPGLGDFRIKAEIFKLIYGCLDFFLSENPKNPQGWGPSFFGRVVNFQLLFSPHFIAGNRILREGNFLILSRMGWNSPLIIKPPFGECFFSTTKKQQI